MTTYAIDFNVMLDELASRLEVARYNSYFTEIEMKRWINFGIIETAKKTKVVNAVKFLHLSAGVNRYSCPSDWLYGQNRQVLYLRSGSLSGYQYPLTKLDRRGMQTTMGSLSNNVLSAMSYNVPSQGAPNCYLLDGNVIEFHPIPTSGVAGANRICFKFPGIPDQLSATSAVPEIPAEYRLLPVTFAEHLGQLKSKDARADATLKKFLMECELCNGEIKWGDQEDPPSMRPEGYYQNSEASTF